MSYIETIRPQLTRRGDLVAETIAKTLRIVDAYAEADPGIGSPLRTKVGGWNADEPDECVWFNLLDEYGEPLEGDAAGRFGRVSHRVASAALQFADGVNAVTAFTVQVQPPNVLGHDGSPLAPNQIEGVLSDLSNYEAALTQPATVAAPTPV